MEETISLKELFHILKTFSNDPRNRLWCRYSKCYH